MRTSLLALLLLLVAACSSGKKWDERLDEILTSESDSPEQRIGRLEAFLEEGPPVETAGEVRFTLGWTFAEVLHQYPEARRWFNALVEADPQGAWADEARWMLENMEKDPGELLPQLQNQAIPPGEARPEGGGAPPPAGL
jgi:hypothetical protein